MKLWEEGSYLYFEGTQSEQNRLNKLVCEEEGFKELKWEDVTNVK